MGQGGAAQVGPPDQEAVEMKDRAPAALAEHNTGVVAHPMSSVSTLCWSPPDPQFVQLFLHQNYLFRGKGSSDAETAGQTVGSNITFFCISD